MTLKNCVFRGKSKVLGIRVANFTSATSNQMGKRTMSIGVNVLDYSLWTKLVKGATHAIELENGDNLPCEMTLTAVHAVTAT